MSEEGGGGTQVINELAVGGLSILSGEAIGCNVELVDDLGNKEDVDFVSSHEYLITLIEIDLDLIRVQVIPSVRGLNPQLCPVVYTSRPPIIAEGTILS